MCVIGSGAATLDAYHRGATEELREEGKSADVGAAAAGRREGACRVPSSDGACQNTTKIGGRSTKWRNPQNYVNYCNG